MHATASVLYQNSRFFLHGLRVAKYRQGGWGGNNRNYGGSPIGYCHLNYGDHIDEDASFCMFLNLAEKITDDDPNFLEVFCCYHRPWAPYSRRHQIRPLQTFFHQNEAMWRPNKFIWWSPGKNRTVFFENEHVLFRTWVPRFAGYLVP